MVNLRILPKRDSHHLDAAYCKKVSSVLQEVISHYKPKIQFEVKFPDFRQLRTNAIYL